MKPILPCGTAIFSGEYQDVINIWESFRNGHWQLYTSKVLVQIFGGVNEKNKERENALSVSPNPFQSQITLTFMSEITGKASVVLYDYLGRQVSNLLETDLQKGNQSWVIDPEKVTGDELPSGIYFIRLRAKGINYSVKLIKSAN
jgi:hypothetical protein